MNTLREHATQNVGMVWPSENEMVTNGGCLGAATHERDFMKYTRIVITVVGFFILNENLGPVKEKPTRKTCFPVKRSTWLHTSTLQNFARRHFFDVSEVSVVLSWKIDTKTWKIDTKTGESIWKGQITKAL